jgi:hypothetical protein
MREVASVHVVRQLLQVGLLLGQLLLELAQLLLLALADRVLLAGALASLEGVAVEENEQVSIYFSGCLQGRGDG